MVKRNNFVPKLLISFIIALTINVVFDNHHNILYAATDCDEAGGYVKVKNAGDPISGAKIWVGGTQIATTDGNGIWTYTPGRTFSLTTVKATADSYTNGSTGVIAARPGRAGQILCKVEDILLEPASSSSASALVPSTFVGNIQLIAIALGVIIAIIRIILGGYKLMSGGDDPIALEEGRDMITSSILGLLVILFAVTLFRIIASNILGIIKVN